jgi:uncharacterized membrane protein
MPKKRKIALAIILAVVLAGHVALFAAGGTWRTTGIALLVVDVISGWFIIGALHEFKKAEAEKDSK